MKVRFLFASCLGVIILSSCSKSDNRSGTFATGTLIGVDPCTARYSENKNRGFVIKYEYTDVTSGANITDTAITYNLPDVFDIPKELFPPRIIDYLFPEEYRNKYRFEFTFTQIPSSELVILLCPGDMYAAPMYAATEGLQIRIGRRFKILP